MEYVALIEAVAVVLSKYMTIKPRVVDERTVYPGLKWPPFFANYSLMVILIEKLIRKMNIDIYRVIEFIFST